MRQVLVVIFACLYAWAAAADTRTGTPNDRVRTLQARSMGMPLSVPAIGLDTGDRLEICFDHLAEDREYLRYELIHCNADWEPSGLVDPEFLDGFNQGSIEDFDFSRLTSTHYVHYSFELPNESVRPKISGNYLVRIYPEGNPDDTWAQLRFMVTEQVAPISASMTSRTDVDTNKGHQQLSITVDTERAGVRDPFNDIIVKVQQNGRYDNEATLRQPLRMASRHVSVYEHQAPLIFAAGNEYRRMETVSVTSPSMGVASIGYAEPFYHMALYTDVPRDETMYLYDMSLHGGFIVREYNSEQSDVEADYIVTHFTLDAPEAENAKIFIDGDFTYRRFDPEALMTYNRATGLYERNMLLKQGAYSYQYLTVPDGESTGLTAPVEGDKYQTNNEYLIKVYAREPGGRYDRLVGVDVIN